MRLRPDHIQSRRALAACVAVSLVTLGSSPSVANATTPTCTDITALWASGTVVEIVSADELYCIGENPDTLDLDYRLSNDLDLSTLAVDATWRPIGSSQVAFTGSFDGGGNTITGLSINQPTDMELGLFGFIRDASIGNVTLATPIVNGGDFIGSLVGEAIDSTITGVTATSVDVTTNLLEATVGGLIGSMTSTDVEGVTVTGSVQALADQTIDDDEGVGGVIGRIWDGGIAGRSTDTTEVSNASFSGSVSGPSLVGGVIGHADTDPSAGTKNLTLTNLASDGSVTSTVDFTEALYPWGIGGVIGMVFDADLNDVRSTATIDSGIPYTGGLVGRFIDSNLRDAEASGSVTTSVVLDGSPANLECSTGGLIGAAMGNQASPVTITEVSAAGDVTCMNGSYTGGLIGWADSASITSAHASGDVRGSSDVAVAGLARSYLGGLVGWVGGASTVRDVASTGSTVTGWLDSDAGVAPSPAYYGGLVGYLDSGSIERAYTTSSLVTDTDIDQQDPTIGSMIGVSEGTLTGLSFTSTDSSTLQIIGTATTDSGNAVYRSLSDLGEFDTYTSWNASDPSAPVIVNGWVSPSIRTTQVWGTCAAVASGLPFLQWQQRTEVCPWAPNPPSPSPDNGGNGGNAASGSGSSQSPSAASGTASASQASSNDSLVTQAGALPLFRQPTAPQPVTGTVTLVPANVAGATPTRAMRQEASATLRSAPTVSVTANQPVKLMVPGFTPGGTYIVQVKSNNGYVVLGSVKADANGQLQMPVFRKSDGASTTTIAIVSTSGEASYVKVKTTKKRGAGERNRTRGAAAGNRR